MIPTTPLGFLYLFLAALVAGFGWHIAARLVSKL